MPYFEFIDGIKGKNLYDLKHKYHFVIYKSYKTDLEKYEDEFEKANVKLIDEVQLTGKEFLKKTGFDEKNEFIIVVDRYGTIQYIGDKIPSFDEIMDIIFFAEQEGCCPL